MSDQEKPQTTEVSLGRPLFTFIINAALSEAVLDGVEMFRQQHGRLFDVRLFNVHDVDEGRTQAEQVRNALKRSNMVFLDIRGGGKAAGLSASALREGTQPVLVLVGGSPELMGLLRLGSFSLKSVMDRGRGRSERKAGIFSPWGPCGTPETGPGPCATGDTEERRTSRTS